MKFPPFHYLRCTAEEGEKLRTVVEKIGLRLLKSQERKVRKMK